MTPPPTGWTPDDAESRVPVAERCAATITAVRRWSTPERIALAVGALADLSVAARLHATTAALAEVGTDEAVAAVRRAEAERILTGAPVEVAEHAVDRLARRLPEPARARLARTLVESLGFEAQDALLAHLAELAGAQVPQVPRGAGESACAASENGMVVGARPPAADAEGSGVVETGAALASAGELLDHVAAETLSGAVDDPTLQRSVDALVLLGRKADAERMRRLDEISQRGSHGARSTADMVQQRYGLTAGAARRELETARQLRDLPATRARLADGTLDQTHAAEAGRALTEVRRAAARGRLDVEQAQAATRRVDELTGATGPTEDPVALRRRLHAANVAGGTIDLDERQRRAHENRRLYVGASTRPGEEGMIAIDGALDPIAGARLKATLERHAHRHGTDDERSKLQRMADALTAGLGDGSAPAPRTPQRPPHPAEQADQPPGADARAASAGDGDDRPGGQGDTPPPRSTAPAQVLLVTTVEALHGTEGAEPSWLDGHGPVGTETARQICCDAQLRVVIVDEDGQPLKVGRRHYRPNDAQRAAVIARDRTCVGCGAPAALSQCHHVKFWDRDHGLTDVDNLCLLCASCHTNVHNCGWTVERDADGRYVAGRSQSATTRAPPRPG